MDSRPAQGVPVTAAGDAPKDPGASESHQSYTEKDFEGTCTTFFINCIFLYGWELFFEATWESFCDRNSFLGRSQCFGILLGLLLYIWKNKTVVRLGLRFNQIMKIGKCYQLDLNKLNWLLDNKAKHWPFRLRFFEMFMMFFLRFFGSIWNSPNLFEANS